MFFRNFFSAYVFWNEEIALSGGRKFCRESRSGEVDNDNIVRFLPRFLRQECKFEHCQHYGRAFSSLVLCVLVV